MIKVSWLNFNFRKALFWGLVILLPIMTLPSKKKGLQDHWFDQPFFWITSAAETGFSLFSSSIKSTVRTYLNLVDLRLQSDSILAENEKLKSQILNMEEILAENSRLREMFGFQQQTLMSLVAARALAYDLLQDQVTVRINKGSQHGIKPGMGVITTKGVVGHVLKLTPFSAQVLLLTDRFSVVDALVMRSRAQGLVEGGGAQKPLEFRFVAKDADISNGDLIVTSGLDQIFPKGLPVARVKRTENRRYSASLQIMLEPEIELYQLDEVFVVINSGNRDLENLFAPIEASLLGPSSQESQ
jgi:rod shape-determining protein MreC